MKSVATLTFTDEGYALKAASILRDTLNTSVRGGKRLELRERQGSEPQYDITVNAFEEYQVGLLDKIMNLPLSSLVGLLFVSTTAGLFWRSVEAPARACS